MVKKTFYFFTAASYSIVKVSFLSHSVDPNKIKFIVSNNFTQFDKILEYSTDYFDDDYIKKKSDKYTCKVLEFLL